jgi:t-SNARE complex subunit (syntaxin)
MRRSMIVVLAAILLVIPGMSSAKMRSSAKGQAMMSQEMQANMAKMADMMTKMQQMMGKMQQMTPEQQKQMVDSMGQMSRMMREMSTAHGGQVQS